MRTTVDLPEELLKRAKIAAVERGTTLRVLVAVALTKELSSSSQVEPEARRVRFPIFSAKKPGSLDLTSGDIATVQTREDRRRHGLSG